MSIEQRVLTCRVLEKMKEQKGYSKKLGLENASTIHGKEMNCYVKFYSHLIQMIIINGYLTKSLGHGHSEVS